MSLYLFVASKALFDLGLVLLAFLLARFTPASASASALGGLEKGKMRTRKRKWTVQWLWGALISTLWASTLFALAATVCLTNTYPRSSPLSDVLHRFITGKGRPEEGQAEVVAMGGHGADLSLVLHSLIVVFGCGFQFWVTVVWGGYVDREDNGTGDEGEGEGEDDDEDKMLLEMEEGNRGDGCEEAQPLLDMEKGELDDGAGQEEEDVTVEARSFV